MTKGLIQKSSVKLDDMEKINRFTRKELSPEQVYTFNISLCNNDIDRDYEKFSVDALYELAELFLGKTGICDHSMKSADQKARIYDTYVEKCNGVQTADGEQLYVLKARAYMLNNDSNRQLIDEIDAGIKKEVSVSCSMGKSVCSICSSDKRNSRCEHIAGREYNGKLCYKVLSNATDAYEFSFVAVPAQREAGVTKSFSHKEDADMNSIVKTICACENDVTITKSQAKELSSYIDSLKEDAVLGEEYKKQLSKEVVKLFSKSFPNMDTKLFSSITSVMTTKELLGFRDGMKTDTAVAPAPQFAPANDKASKQDYSQFRI